MQNFMDVIESIEAEDASATRLFERDAKDFGSPINESARRRVSGTSKEYKIKLLRAGEFFQDVCEGRRDKRLLVKLLTETHSTSDFPILFQDILDRTLLEKYAQVDLTWPQYIKESTVPDFRPVSRRTLDGADGTLEHVPELSEYPEATLTEGQFTYKVSKFGRRIPLSMETIINDDIGALRSIPDDFALAARETEEVIATQLYADINGPRSDVFKESSNNVIVDGTTPNPALSFAALEAAIKQIRKIRSVSGRPIRINMAILVVPPELEIEAYKILAATTVEVGSQTSAQRTIVPNYLNNRVRVVTNEYLPMVINGPKGDTSWFLFAEPVGNRAACELGFLASAKAPQIFMKSSNAVRIGGGEVGPTEGDFDTDSVQYKVRHILGGSPIDVKLMSSSNGTGIA